LRLRAFRDPASHGLSCRKVKLAQTVKTMLRHVALSLQERTLVSLVWFIFNTAT
jgi:hypothetical protein